MFAILYGSALHSKETRTVMSTNLSSPAKSARSMPVYSKKERLYLILTMPISLLECSMNRSSRRSARKVAEWASSERRATRRNILLGRRHRGEERVTARAAVARAVATSLQKATLPILARVLGRGTERSRKDHQDIISRYPRQQGTWLCPPAPTRKEVKDRMEARSIIGTQVIKALQICRIGRGAMVVLGNGMKTKTAMVTATHRLCLLIFVIMLHPLPELR